MFCASLVIFFIVCLSLSETQDWHEKNKLTYSKFLSRDNSNITYLIYESKTGGPIVQSCEYVNAVWYEFGNHKIIETNRRLTGPYIKTYFSAAPAGGPQINDRAEYHDDIGCLNCLIQDWIGINEQKAWQHLEGCRNFFMSIKNYLRTNIQSVRVSELNRLKLPGEGGSLTYTNNASTPGVYETETFETTVTETTVVNFTLGLSITAKAEVSIPLLKKVLDASASVSAKYSDDWSKVHTLTTSRKIIKPKQTVHVSPFTRVMAMWEKFEIQKLYEYTVDLEVKEDERFMKLRNYIREGKMTLHQRDNGIWIDLSNDNLLVLRNVPVKEMYSEYDVQFRKDESPL